MKQWRRVNALRKRALVYWSAGSAAVAAATVGWWLTRHARWGPGGNAPSGVRDVLKIR